MSQTAPDRTSIAPMNADMPPPYHLHRCVICHNEHRVSAPQERWAPARPYPYCCGEPARFQFTKTTEPTTTP